MRNVINKIVISFICAAALFTGCSKKERFYTSSENDSYVEAISKARLERLDPITITFTDIISDFSEKSIRLEPKQAGTWTKTDGRTLQFTPEKPYKADSIITLSADIASLLGKEIDGDAMYKHSFMTEEAKFDIVFSEVRLISEENGFTLKGQVSTDIPVSLENLRHTVSAKFGMKRLDVNWSGSDGSQDKHVFSIPMIVPSEKGKELSISWNGKKIGLRKNSSSYKGNKKILIPAINDFSIINISNPDIHSVIVSFSKMLDETQPLSGLVSSVEKISSFISDNILTIYNDQGFLSTTNFSIAGDVRSSDGTYLSETRNISVGEAWLLPEVKFLNDGCILPTTQGTILPLKTRNLKGLLIQAYAIYDYNMTQFLQVNELDGSKELYRVGEPVWEKNVSFEWNDSMKDKEIPQGIDISELVKKYPDGMFQIKVTFRKENICYKCNNSHNDFSNLAMPENSIGTEKRNEESSYWDWSYDMDWEERQFYRNYKNDPCHPAFYKPEFNSNCLVTKRVLVTDIGVMAKKSVDGKLYVTVADIKTASPIQNATVTMYTFVGSKIKEGKTDSNGCLIFDDCSNTTFVTVKNNKQTSYLKLSNGTEMNVSHFETGGAINENGMKGFIYGERSVWRPGDDIFLTFILQNVDGKIPDDIPVTFELEDPLGRIKEKRILDKSVNGFYSIVTGTESNDVTGYYTAKIKIGGKTWMHGLRVETVVPNRLSVKLENEGKYLTRENNRFILKGAWLHGAAAAGYQADVSVSFSDKGTKFNNFSEYVFSNPNRYVESSKETLWEGNLGSNSEVEFNADISTSNSIPGKLNARIISRIFEPSGAFSTEVINVPYSPYRRYVGLRLPKGDAVRDMLLTDTDHTSDVVLVDPDGTPVNENATLGWQIYKLQWKWWWEKDCRSDTKFISSDSYSSIASGVVNIENGKGKFDFNVKSPEWGRYLVVVTDMDGGHSAGKVVYIDWPGWAGRSQESGSGSAFMLPLVSNKKKYSSGETAEISFGSSKGQRALVTIEKAGKILKQDWLETKDGTTVYKLPLTDNMAPNIYAHITLLQEHMQTANSLPIRLYGVIPLEVENPQTRLEPVITMADRFEPNKECTVSVSEKNGRGMTYTIAIVDEGLLGLTNHHVPDVWSQFYKKEASRLSSWDLYTYVMNAYSGKLETILAVGGGEDSTDSRDRESNRFKPVVKYFGPFTIQPGEKKATKFMMPSYIGAVRAMVVAADNGSYGTAEKTALVKTDIMVQSALPRTLGAGETINVPVTVFNLTDKSQDFNVRLAASGALNLNLEQSVNIRTNDNATVFFKVPAEKTGTAKFNIKTSSGQLTSEENIEVPVLSRGTPVTYRENYIIAAGKSKTVSLNAKNLESIIVKNEISTIPEINLERWLDYLVKYPHGCIEQITSGGFPQMYLPAFIKLSPEKIEKIKENVNSVIRRYTDYQSASGGFAYWPGNSVPDKWGSCYGAHFLLEAKKNGYTVPDNLFDPLMKFIQEQASAWRIEDDESNNETQAYALFVLAMAKKQNLTAMNRMQDYIDASSISSTARLLLSASYALAGDSKTAVKIMRGIGISELFFRSTGGSFSSSFREKAMHLYAGTVTGELASNAKLASEIAEFLKNENWLSTQDVAWALMALMPYYINQASSPAGYELEYDGKSMAGIIEKRISVDDLGEKAHGGMEKLTVKNTAKQALYGLFYVSGMAEPGTEMLQNDRIKLTVSYKDDNGRKIAPEALKNGDNFKIIIEVSKLDSNKKYENLALTFPVPTAWEINNERLGKESGDSSSSYDYQDIRDSYIYTYFNLASNKTATFSFDATVCYSGKYYIPAVHAEAMYDNTISAVVPGKLISE